MAIHSSSFSFVRKGDKRSGKLFLVSVTVSGSCGPIRFPVKEEESVANVISMVLKKYAHEGRLPILKSDSSYTLRCVNPGYDALNALERIGESGCRNFILFKEEKEELAKGMNSANVVGRKGSGSWKSLAKSLGLMISTH